jgi:hypothetical protein
MNGAVEQAIEEIRNAFPEQEHRLDADPDEEGGAYIKVHDLFVGDQYEPSLSWIAFRITFQYPYADVYPHFCIASLKRKDGAGVGAGFNLNQTWNTPRGSEPAILMSRRSNRLNPESDTAALKLAKVLDWMRTR